MQDENTLLNACILNSNHPFEICKLVHLTVHKKIYIFELL